MSSAYVVAGENDQKSTSADGIAGSGTSSVKHFVFVYLTLLLLHIPFSSYFIGQDFRVTGLHELHR